MSDDAVGFLVLLWISTGVAIVVHAFERRVARASFMSALLATVLFQTVAYLHAETLDMFFPIAVVVGGFYSWLLALMIGYIFSKVRPHAHLAPRR